MQWMDDYKKKVVTADEAVRHIKSGDRVVFGHAAGEPKVLVEALVRNASLYKNVEIVHMVALGKGEYCNPEYVENFTHNALFAGASTRKAIAEGRAIFTPCHFSRIPSLFKDKVLPVDVALIMVSTPDEHGYCSYGVSVDYTKPAAECAKIVIAEVTPNMPRTYGDSFIHVSEIDYIVESDSTPALLNPPTLTETDEKIGKYIAELINDGDCLQLG
ncbi:MAG TPA: 4-hydroxybutyrate CoA-transferase, partial [Spirochaetota bacterium]|nr:4-hydroxybutyrate CoA-transferase [Spirochaetota bacterium]